MLSSERQSTFDCRFGAGDWLAEEGVREYKAILDGCSRGVNVLLLRHKLLRNLARPITAVHDVSHADLAFVGIVEQTEQPTIAGRKLALKRRCAVDGDRNRVFDNLEANGVPFVFL